MKCRGYFKAIVFFALGILVVSCKKDPIQYSFSGTVTESVNQSALSGVEVDISQRVYNGNVASTFFNSAGVATTGSDGTYEMSFNREKVIEFKVEMSKSGYFDSELLMNSSEVSTDEVKEIDETLEPEAWIRMDLTNVGGMASDIFTMIHYNFRVGCSGCTTNDYYYYEGIVDTSFIIMTTGGVYTKYSFKNPGGVNYIQDSVYTTPFDTVDVIINY